nr:reverse transcriptase domain-containing protein [Tanacetum cinerariifolium]
MPKFASTIKSLLVNKDKLFELAKVPLNENCLAMLLKKIPEKLGDPELTPTRMTFELADRSITRPKGVSGDIFIKVGKFHFPTDFVVVNFEADPIVPLILGRSFLRTGRALIDVYGEEITLRVNDESITFNLSQTLRYSSTYDDTSVNRVDVIDVACEDLVQDVLDFQYNPKSSNPTLISNLVEIVNKQIIAPAKAIEKTCVTCGGAHAYYECIATDSNPSSVCAATGSYSQVSSQNRASHQIPPPGFASVQNNPNRFNQEHSNSSGSTSQVQPLVVPISISEPNVPRTQTKPSIPYPSRLNDQKLREKATNQMEKFFQIFHDLHFDIGFAYALILMQKFVSTIMSLLANKVKLFELTKVPLNENCSAMLLKKHPENLGDPELTPTRMTLELADRSITRLKGVAEDIFIKVGKFHFLTDFVVVDFEADPRVPLILGRSFLRIGRALIDVYGEEITLRVNDESITFNLNQTMSYSLTYDDTLVNRVDVIDIACEDFVQDVLDFQYNPKSSSPTLDSDDLIYESNACKVPIVKSSSPTLTPFRESDFFLEEIEDFLNDDSIPTGIENSIYDPEGEPHELELKELPSHLEYAFLEDSNKLPVIIAKNLIVDKREALINVLKSHKRAIAWKISDIKGIDLRFCTHKILMEDDYKPAMQSQRRVNPNIHDVIKKEVIKLLDAGHKISKSGIEVDRAKVDVIAKLPHPTTVKGVRSFIGHAALKYLLNKQDAKPRLLRWVLLLQEFDITILDKKGYENLAADHLSRFENPHQDVLEDKDINENFTLETLGSLTSHNTPWQEAFEILKVSMRDLPKAIMTAGNHRKLQLNELSELRDQAYENSVIYKERTKKLHDSKIKNRIFNVCDQVLLFNSRLKIFSGKLKTRWSGPFTITRVFPYGTIELSQPNGPNFKVNGHRVKHYFGFTPHLLKFLVFNFIAPALFDDEEIHSDKLDTHCFNVESLSNRDTLIDSSPKFDFLEEFSGAFMPISIADEERIRREHAEYISLMERLFTINTCPRPMENSNTIVESLSTSTTLVKDNDLSFPRPPPKPPDVEFDFEPNLGEVISAVMNNIEELIDDECFDPRREIDVFANNEDDDYFSFIFVIRIFLPYLIYPDVSPLLLSAGSEDTIFDPGISV